MDFFQHKAGEAYCEGIPLSQIADRFSTPTYVYSSQTIDRHCDELKSAFGDYPVIPCFAVKSNSNLSVLKRIFSKGYGADVVSIGEFERACLAGVNPHEIVFSGVGKQNEEITKALEVGLLSFNVESEHELRQIADIARIQKRTAPISLRINPNIEAKTNPYIATGLYNTKFGIAEDTARELLSFIKNESALHLVGISCHIGSQITDLHPFEQAIDRLVGWASELRQMDFQPDFLDLGGGLGIRYTQSENPPTLTQYAQSLLKRISPTGLKLVIEPGRVLVGNAGILLTRIISVKTSAHKNFIIVDGAMNDLLRPSLYRSYHEILPVNRTTESHFEADVVGPICETGDYLGLERKLPKMKAGELLYVRGCGAYAATMASNYNSRPRAPEVMVCGNQMVPVSRRESLKDIWQRELPHVLENS